MYPSGGASYPLEIYATIGACDGLQPGVYRYRPAARELGQIGPLDSTAGRLLDGAAGAMGVDERPQVLISLALRYPRVAWKYEGIAYSLALKEVGALFQTMWLVAGTVGLGGCALGVGDNVSFAEATGRPFYEEEAIGEFALGSLPQD